MKSRTLLIFDIDGTLLANKKAAKEIFFEAFYDITGNNAPELGISFAGFTDYGIFKRLLNSSKSTEPFTLLFPKFRDHFSALMKRKYQAHSDPFMLPGASELLEILSARNDVVMVLGTGNLRKTAFVKLKRFGFDKYFEDGGFGDEFENRADVIKEAVRVGKEKYSCDSKMWVIGDTPRDVEAAREAGVNVLAVATGIVPKEEIKSSNPDILLDNLSNSSHILSLLGL